MSSLDLDFDPSKLDLGDLMDKSQRGIDMVKDMHSKIEGLNNPMINEGLNKIKDIEMLNQLKDIDLNDVKKNVDDMKNKAEGFFKMFG